MSPPVRGPETDSEGSIRWIWAAPPPYGPATEGVHEADVPELKRRIAGLLDPPGLPVSGQ